MREYKKFVVVLISAFLSEIVMTMYINGVANMNIFQTIFFAFISPFISLPFVVYVIQANTMKERFGIACFQGIGYAIGVLTCMYFLK